ncbi:MAG: maleate cis-trans isomerase family protein [Acidimicrobiales bacterium]
MSSSDRTRIGMIVPSSNTVLEPEMCRIAGGLPGVSLHFSRVRVTEITLDDSASHQFDPEPMSKAALLLGDAGVDVLAWAGTSGSWLGIGHDQDLARALGLVAGAPATTSTMALIEACRLLGSSRVALLTPYVDGVVARIMTAYGAEGIEVVAERHLGITDNSAFAEVGEADLRAMAIECAGPGADDGGASEAVVVACTNLRAARLAREIEGVLGIPFVDSVAATLWHAMLLAGRRVSLAGEGCLLEGVLPAQEGRLQKGGV